MSANIFKIQGTAQISSTDISVTMNLGLSYTATGSNFIAGSQRINTGSWQPLFATSSLSSSRLLVGSNEGTKSVIQLAQTAAGGGFFAQLQPGDPIVLPISGSSATSSFFARTLGDFSIFKYWIGEL